MGGAGRSRDIASSSRAGRLFTFGWHVAFSASRPQPNLHGRRLCSFSNIKTSHKHERYAPANPPLRDMYGRSHTDPHLSFEQRRILYAPNNTPLLVKRLW